MKKNYKITISGKVQNVWYRKTAIEKAREMNIKGYIMNLENGDVFAEIEALEQDFEKFVEWCKMGPKDAEVENVEIEHGNIKGFKKIQIVE